MEGRGSEIIGFDGSSDMT
jgi:hypothetical protein